MDSNILKLQLSMNKNSTGTFYIIWGSGPSCCCPYLVFVCGSSSVYLICSVFKLDHYFFAPPAMCLHPEHALFAPPPTPPPPPPVNSASKPSHVRYFTLIFQLTIPSNLWLYRIISCSHHSVLCFRRPLSSPLIYGLYSDHHLFILLICVCIRPYTPLAI